MSSIISNAACLAHRDCRELYKPIHPPNTLENNLSPEQYIGRIDPKLADEVGLGLFGISSIDTTSLDQEKVRGRSSEDSDGP